MPLGCLSNLSVRRADGRLIVRFQIIAAEGNNACLEAGNRLLAREYLDWIPETVVFDAGHPWAITRELDVYLLAAPSGHLEAWHAPRAGRPTEERDAMARLARLLFERDVLSRPDVDRFLLAVESSFMILPA
jgi:hypothetical protein